MGYAQQIGRVGALALALGVGIGLGTAPGVAFANETGSTAASSADDTRSTSGDNDSRKTRPEASTPDQRDGDSSGDSGATENERQRQIARATLGRLPRR